MLTDARRPSRFAGGELVPLRDQDRAGWDRDLVAEGHALVRECLAREQTTGVGPGRYQLLAAINAVHTDAPDARDTDWGQITALYDQLVALDRSPIVRLNRAVAVAEMDGPSVALAEVDRLDLTTYHAWHATRADLLRRLGRTDEARSAYDAAIEHAGNAAERAWLARRRGRAGRVALASRAFRYASLAFRYASLAFRYASLAFRYASRALVHHEFPDGARSAEVTDDRRRREDRRAARARGRARLALDLAPRLETLAPASTPWRPGAGRSAGHGTPGRAASSSTGGMLRRASRRRLEVVGHAGDDDARARPSSGS